MSVHDDSVQRGPRRAHSMPVRFATDTASQLKAVSEAFSQPTRRSSRYDSPSSPLEAFQNDSRPHRSDMGERDRNPRGSVTQEEGSRGARRGRLDVFNTRYVKLEQPRFGSDDDESERRHRYDRQPSSGNRYNDDESSSSDDDSDRESSTDAYEFALSHHSNSQNGQDAASLSVSELSEKDTVENSPTPAKSPTPGKIYRVLRSKYTGERYYGGLHSAKLTVINDVCHGPEKGRPSLFRWAHFDDVNMNFNDFHEGVLRMTGLANTERAAIFKVLRCVQKKYDKPMPTAYGMKARFMIPCFLQERFSRESGSASPKSSAVSWLCLPYFCLEKYSNVSHSSRSSSHPMITLLQARLSSTPKERDMEQAVCHIPYNKEGHCFHIAQVWCLLIDESLLITYGRTPIADLQGDSILFDSRPTSGDPELQSPQILVHSGPALLWSFCVDECQSWFAFISHFWEYWPWRIRIKYQKSTITADDWPRILALAKKSHVRLQLYAAPSIKNPRRGVLIHSDESFQSQSLESDHAINTGKTTPEEERDAQASTAQINTSDNAPGAPIQRPPKPPLNIQYSDFHGKFHVFAWLNARRALISIPEENSEVPNVNINVDSRRPSVSYKPIFSNMEHYIKEDLGEIDHFLTHQVNIVERMMYQKCIPRTRQIIYKLLADESTKLTGGAGKDLSFQRIYETKIDLVNAAETLFQFFLPSQFDGPTVQKYWGAIYYLLFSLIPSNPIEVEGDRDNNDDEIEHNSQSPSQIQQRHSDMIKSLQRIARHVQVFTEIFSRAKLSDQLEIELREEFPKAWLHLLISLIVGSKEAARFHGRIIICDELLDRGMQKMVRRSNLKSLAEHAVFMPHDVALLISSQILQDITGASPDINETYWEYMARIEFDIQESPLDREHQDKITLFRQEVSVILETLRKQRRLISGMQYDGQTRLPEHERIRNSERRDVYAGPGRRRTTDYIDVDDPEQQTKVSGRHISRVDTSHYSSDGRYGTLDYGSSSAYELDATEISGMKELLSRDNLALIDQRIRNFTEMTDRSFDLERWNIQKIDSNKDRQESAIYAFTIVTIVFLPISAVAGILGMNTNDVRNMETNQWVFWAVAIPLTVIVITLCLIWAGELENFWSGFSNLWSGGRRRRPKARFIVQRSGPSNDPSYPRSTRFRDSEERREVEGRYA